jgi:hypothetical protein
MVPTDPETGQRWSESSFTGLTLSHPVVGNAVREQYKPESFFIVLSGFAEVSSIARPK